MLGIDFWGAVGLVIALCVVIYFSIKIIRRSPDHAAKAEAAADGAISKAKSMIVRLFKGKSQGV